MTSTAPRPPRRSVRPGPGAAAVDRNGTHRRRRIGPMVLLAIVCGIGPAAATTRAAVPDWVTSAASGIAAENAASADAVILFLGEEVTYLSPDRVRTRRRSVVRIVSDGGRKHAAAGVVYRPECEKVVTARAWTVAGPRGKQDTYDHHDFVDHVLTYDNYVWDSQRVLSFSAGNRVAAGDLFASEIVTESTSGLFDSSHDFYFDLPISRRLLEVTPPEGLTLGWHASSDELPPPTPGSGRGSLRWDVRGLPRRIGTEPDGFLVNPLRVSVHPVGEGPAARSWATLAAQLHAVIEPRLSGDAAVRQKATELAAGAGSRWDKIRAVAQFVQRDIYYLSITTDRDYLAGYRPHAPAQVLAHRYGDCKDKAALMVALLRELGETGWMVLMHSQNPKALVSEWPSASFNHAIVAVPADAQVPSHWPSAESPGLGRVVLFDPTDPVTPLGLLPAGDEAGLGLAVAEATSGVLHLPAAAAVARRLDRAVTGSLTPKGELTATIVETHEGAAAAEAYSRRWGVRDVDYGHRVQRRIGEILPLARELTWQDTWDPLAAQYQLTIAFKAGGFGRSANNTLLFVCPKLLPDYGRLEPWTLPAEGVSWQRAESVAETARLRLPEGFAVESLPEEVTNETPQLKYRLRYRTEGAEVVFSEEVVIKSGFLDRAAYASLADAFSMLRQQERRMVTLRRTAVTGTPR